MKKKEVSVAFIESDDKMMLFLLKRNDALWGLPGGALKTGETKMEAMIREVFEETSIDLQKELIIDCGTLITDNKIINIFYCLLWKNFPVIKLSKEHEDYIFVDTDMIDNLFGKMKPNCRNAYQIMQEHINKFINDHKAFIP